MGTRGQYFGPTPGPGLRREVSNHGKHFFKIHAAHFLNLIFVLFVILSLSFVPLSQSGEDQNHGLPQEGSQAQEARPAGNHTSLFFCLTCPLLNLVLFQPDTLNREGC